MPPKKKSDKGKKSKSKKGAEPVPEPVELQTDKELMLKNE